MLQHPQIEHDAPWKQRFRAPTIPWATIAANEPRRGLVMTNTGDSYQLYAWDVPTGELTQLTNRAEGVPLGVLSPDGRYVYYLDDRQGNEIGHYVRVPMEGGEPEDITPELPPYAASAFAFSRSGNMAAMVVANADGFHLYALDFSAEGRPGAPRKLYQSKRIMRGLALSHDGEMVAVGSSERSGSLEMSLLTLDTATGRQIAELWDGPESSIESAIFSPLASDARLLATTNHSGVQRPLLWNPLTGERRDLPLDSLQGEIRPWTGHPMAGASCSCNSTRLCSVSTSMTLSGSSFSRSTIPTAPSPTSAAPFSGRKARSSPSGRTPHTPRR